MSAALSSAVPMALSGISDAPAELEQTRESQNGCSKPDQAPMSEDQENHELGTTQFYGNGRPLQYEEFNTAFYGHLPDGSPAFGVQHDDQSMKHRRADLQEDDPSPNIRTIPNSPAVGVQRPAVHDDTVGEHGIQNARLKRRRSSDAMSGAGVKRPRLSKPDDQENLACKARSRVEGDQPEGKLAAVSASEEQAKRGEEQARSVSQAGSDGNQAPE